MLTELSVDDARFLMDRPEFRRFLYLAIQKAGILSHEAPANGQLGRDLGHFEGRRSLGFELLQMADLGQPDPLRTPEALGTISAALIEAMNPPPKEKARGKRTDDTARFDELADD